MESFFSFVHFFHDVQPLSRFGCLDLLIIIYSMAAPSSTHLAQQGTVLFFFFLIAFNTVQSHLIFFPKATVRGILSVSKL